MAIRLATHNTTESRDMLVSLDRLLDQFESSPNSLEARVGKEAIAAGLDPLDARVRPQAMAMLLRLARGSDSVAAQVARSQLVGSGILHPGDIECESAPPPSSALVPVPLRSKLW